MLISAFAILVGILALWKRFHGAGLFLLVLAASDLLRPLLAPLRAGYARPYEGVGFALWLATDVALFLAPPAVLLMAIGRRRLAVAFWVMAIAVVALSYPELRGDALIRFYAAVYLATYALTAGVLIWRGMWRERMLAEELGLLFLVVAGAASTYLVLRFGMPNWWAVWITNGAAYAAVLVLGLAQPRPGGSSPPALRGDGRDAPSGR